GLTGCACGGEIEVCISVGPGPKPGVVTVVGMPLGVDTPGLPPRIPPAPGKLPNEPPPPPGKPPKTQFNEPGHGRTLLPTVGACAPARPLRTQKATTKDKARGPARRATVSASNLHRRQGMAVPRSHMNPSRKFTCLAPCQSFVPPHSALK